MFYQCGLSEQPTTEWQQCDATHEPFSYRYRTVGVVIQKFGPFPQFIDFCSKGTFLLIVIKLLNEMSFSAVEMDQVCFSFAAQRNDFNIEATKNMLLASMCAALRIDPGELCFLRCQEDAVNWFNVIFEIPKRSELLDTLRRDAMKKAPWLNFCAVKAVMIGEESQILMQPITLSPATPITTGLLQGELLS